MYLTIEESTTENISPLLEIVVKNIMSGCRTSETTQKDYLFVLIIVLMMENGFSPLNDELEALDAGNLITIEEFNKWKMAMGAYDAAFIMSGFKNVKFKVILSPLGSTALLNVILKDLDSETYSVCLPISRYIVSPQASTIPMVFRDLRQFSTILKNKIVSPVKSRILSHCGYPSASLIGLPEEVLFKILLHVPVTDITNVGKTCTRLKYVIDNETFWHDMCKRDFPDITQTERNDWKVIYRNAFISKRDREQRNICRAAGTMHDYMDYSDFVSYIDNPMWDVII